MFMEPETELAGCSLNKIRQGVAYGVRGPSICHLTAVAKMSNSPPPQAFKDSTVIMGKASSRFPSE